MDVQESTHLGFDPEARRQQGLLCPHQFVGVVRSVFNGVFVRFLDRSRFRVGRQIEHYERVLEDVEIAALDRLARSFGQYALPVGAEHLDVLMRS